MSNCPNGRPDLIASRAFVPNNDFVRWLLYIWWSLKFYALDFKWKIMDTRTRQDYSNVGWLFCTPAPPKFTKKLAVDSFFNFGS